jgi:hypothetical protein
MIHIYYAERRLQALQNIHGNLEKKKEKIGLIAAARLHLNSILFERKPLLGGESKDSTME